jgi:Uma2 family endonuclease
MIAETAFRSEEEFDQRDFRRWLHRRPSSDLNHYELINGRIVMTPPAGWPHGGVEAAIVERLSRHAREQGLGIVLGSSAGYELPSGDTVEPDVSFISARRFAAGPKPSPGKFLRIVPTLAVEIISPTTARRDRTEKRKIYEQNRVEEYWLVDPIRKDVTVYVLGKSSYASGRSAKTGRVPSRVLAKLGLEVEEIFTL